MQVCSREGGTIEAYLSYAAVSDDAGADKDVLKGEQLRLEVVAETKLGSPIIDMVILLIGVRNGKAASCIECRSQAITKRGDVV